MNSKPTITEKRGLQPLGLRVEYIANPVGIDIRKPRFSWEFAEAGRGQRQTAYRLLVADDEASLTAGIGGLWDSGIVASADTLQIEYGGKPLVSGRRYHWTVRCWNQEGEQGEAGPGAFFETALLDANEWTAHWIGAEEKVSAPLFRKPFCIGKPVKQATVYVSGLGYSELYLNGRKIGDQVLAPNWTDYDTRHIEGLLYPFDDQTAKRVSYLTHSVTEALVPGENVVGVMLGNGFYNQEERTVEGRMRYGSPKLILQLAVKYEDGTEETIHSDESWLCSGGPIVFNNVFYGEMYDARREQTGWAENDFDDSDWERVQLVHAPAGLLVSQLSPADQVIGTLAPITRAEVKPEVYRFDFGQNLSGWVRIRMTGAAGQRVTLRFAEELDETGALDMASCGGDDQVQSDVYLMKGGGSEQYEPRFVWHGFRYAEVSGYPGIPELTDLEAVVVHAAVASTGSFACSEPLLNRVQTVYRWSQLTNLHGGVPSDCPHRERLGYTADGHLSAEAAMYNFDMAAFYSKWIADIGDAQNGKTGFVPHTAPFNGGGGGVAWGSALVIMPWLMYRMYGDRRIISEHYAGMKLWIAYLGTRSEGGHLVRFEEPDSWFLGDWCVPGDSLLPPVLVATFYYAYATGIMAQIAGVLGEKEDQLAYSTLYGDICAAIHEAFFDPGRACYSSGKQGADLFPLVLGCVPEGESGRVWDHVLWHYREETDGHLDTGIFGTAFLFDVLSEQGETDTALRMALQPDYPGYGYMLEHGATTLWEAWDGEGSHNHPMFGSISAWMFKHLAGIAPHPDTVAFGHAVLKPFQAAGLDFASATVHTIRGEYAIRWSRAAARRWTAEVVIPANCRADIHLPTTDADALPFALISERDTAAPLWRSGAAEPLPAGDYILRQGNNELIVNTGSGRYCFDIS